MIFLWLFFLVRRSIKETSYGDRNIFQMGKSPVQFTQERRKKLLLEIYLKWKFHV